MICSWPCTGKDIPSAREDLKDKIWYVHGLVLGKKDLRSDKRDLKDKMEFVQYLGKVYFLPLDLQFICLSAVIVDVVPPQ